VQIVATVGAPDDPDADTADVVDVTDVTDVTDVEVLDTLRGVGAPQPRSVTAAITPASANRSARRSCAPSRRHSTNPDPAPRTRPAYGVVEAVGSSDEAS